MVEGIPSNSAAIIDGMSLVKKVNTDRYVPRDVAHIVLNLAPMIGAQRKRIDLVVIYFYSYKGISIKNIYWMVFVGSENKASAVQH